MSIQKHSKKRKELKQKMVNEKKCEKCGKEITTITNPYSLVKRCKCKKELNKKNDFRIYG